MKLHVFPPSPNSRKVLVVNAHLGLDLPLEMVNLATGEQHAPGFVALNPNAKVPVLEYADGGTLWESNAIMARLCAEVDTPLWPKSDIRYDILRWQYWETAHWTPALSPFISRHIFGQMDADLDTAATQTAKYGAVLDTHLAGRDWLVGDGVTLADISVVSILSLRAQCHYPLDGFANIQRWIAAIEALPAWQSAERIVQATLAKVQAAS
ncbi:glutathione S-transferase family protein [Ruegeria sp. PrR005]|uniref:Glutathione S-transferase family protein n=1 Tax=Ruegeria sp. PrR005 TaxID=2706882 RepID=A0A6B2NS22_9RHOB|nr:glutathione S-transferase family protein [Ruegeria sp. PrR005]NDW46956.1 glutathione S-transferase family protein [Ruegeria sp. PrR005]